MTNWETIDSPGDIHVMPVDDLLAHEYNNCACLPETEPVECPDGRVEFMQIHFAWDGRE